MNIRNINLLKSLSNFSAQVLTPQPSEAQELSRREIKVFVKKGRITYRKEAYWKANPSIFITENETEMFIVSTDVKDSYGDRDLYYCIKRRE